MSTHARSRDAGPGADGGRRRRRAGRARAGPGARRARGGGPLRLGLPLLPRRHRHDRGRVHALPADPGPRGGRDDPRGGRRLPAGARGRDARGPLAGLVLRPLLRVQHRARQRVLEHLADRRPRRRGAPAAAARPGRPGLSRRRPGPGARRADRARLDRDARGRARTRRPGRARRRARRRPDRTGSRAGGDRPRRLGAARRHSREPPRPRRRDGRRRAAGLPGESLVAAAREWAGPDGPEVVFEATGVPALVQTAVELVAQAGRVVVVSLSQRAGAGPRRRPAVQGDRRARNELLRLGRVRRRRSSSSGGGATPPRGSSPTSSRSSRRRRRSPTRWSTRPR